MTITTTLDPVLQDAAQAQINNYLPMDNNPDRVGQAMSSIQPGTGKILSMAQNTKLSAPEGQWANNYNFNVDMFDAAGNELGGAGGFATGSTMKPFTFAEWLNSGHRINEIVDASVRKYPLSFPWTNTCGTTTSDYDDNSGNGSKDLRNAENNFYQRLTAREGLYNSLNTATFAMASQLDFCNIQKMMTATGIHDGKDPNKQYDMSFARNLIGNDPVAPLTMAAAFATFAASGTHCDPIALVSVTNVKGEPFPVPGANCKQTVKPEVAAGVTSVLQDVLVRGSGWEIPLQYAAGAKTGTTNDSEQTWTVGFTKGLATASWIGNPDLGSRSSNGLLIANQRIAYVDGATYAGHAWQGYMNQVAGNYDVSFFDLPPANMVNPPVVIAPKPVQTAKPAETKDSSVKTDNKKKD
ncbi:penicillin-binding transpeptidase domain-containing protein [Arthrobacter psychrolactophilus]